MKERVHTHERLKHEAPSAGGSDRNFGVVFAVVFSITGLFPLLRGDPPRGWPFAVAGVLLAAALLKAHWLAPFNRAWTGLGRLLHRIGNPVVLAVIYFGVITPTGLVMRALGKDPLHLRRDPAAASYWIHREPPGPDRGSMTNQF